MKVNKIVSVLMLACFMLVSFSSFAQDYDEYLRTAEDGFQYYKITKNGKEGAKSMGGTIFIPLSRGYTFICYYAINGGWFGVEKNGSEGACDMTGREVIPPKYDDVGKRESDGFYYYMVELNNRVGAYDINGREILTPGRYDKYYIRNKDGFFYISVELNGKEGVCDINGREVIAPRYKWVVYSEGEFKINETGDGWKPTGIKLSSLAQTPTEAPTPTPTPAPQPQPEPQPRQPQPFQVWKTCFMCGGSGQCPYCYGYGWAANGKDACGICHGTGKCSQCAGHGGHNEIEYH